VKPFTVETRTAAMLARAWVGVSRFTFGSAGMFRMNVVASLQKRESSRAGLEEDAAGPAAGAAEDPHPPSSRRLPPAAAAARTR
jgi:hypothetical protein